MAFRDLFQLDPLSILGVLFGPRTGGRQALQGEGEQFAARALSNPSVAGALRHLSYLDVPFDAVRAQAAPLVEGARYALTGMPGQTSVGALTQDAAALGAFANRAVDQYQAGQPYTPQASFGVVGDMVLDPLNWIAPGAGAAGHLGARTALGLTAQGERAARAAPGLRRLMEGSFPPPARGVVPRTAGQVARRDLFDTTLREGLARPEGKAQIEEWVARGRELGGEDWYRPTGTMELLQRSLGDEEAANEFYRALMAMTAATSGNTKVRDNIHRAFNLMSEVFSGKSLADIRRSLEEMGPHPGRVFDHGLGGSTFPAQSVESVLETGQVDSMKMSHFLSNMLGDVDPLTVDVHNFRAVMKAAGFDFRDPQGRVDMARLFGMRDPEKAADITDPGQWSSQLYGRITREENSFLYDIYEDVQREIAQEMGMSPAEFQAAVWVGAGDYTGVADVTPFAELFTTEITKRAEELGRPVEELIQDIYNGRLSFAQVISPEMQTRLMRNLMPSLEDEDLEELDQAMQLGGFTTGGRF